MPIEPTDELSARYEILRSPEWLRFMEAKWSLTPAIERFSCGEQHKDVELAAVLYFDRNGHAVAPARNPYSPVWLESPRALKDSVKLECWLEGASALSRRVAGRTLRGLVLPPTVTDVRPFQWGGLNPSVRYSYVVELPHDESRVASTYRRLIRGAESAGLTFVTDVALDEVHVCMIDTEGRQQFGHALSTDDLEMASTILGKRLRAYGVRGEGGEVVSAMLVLVGEDAVALGWVGGTKSDHLKGGAPQLLTDGVLRSLAADGFTLFDFCGANYQNIAYSKAKWGAKLVPYFTLRPPSVEDRLRALARSWRSRRS